MPPRIQGNGQGPINPNDDDGGVNPRRADRADQNIRGDDGGQTRRELAHLTAGGARERARRIKAADWSERSLGDGRLKLLVKPGSAPNRAHYKLFMALDARFNGHEQLIFELTDVPTVEIFHVREATSYSGHVVGWNFKIRFNEGRLSLIPDPDKGTLTTKWTSFNEQEQEADTFKSVWYRPFILESEGGRWKMTLDGEGRGRVHFVTAPAITLPVASSPASVPPKFTLTRHLRRWMDHVPFTGLTSRTSEQAAAYKEAWSLFERPREHWQSDPYWSEDRVEYDPSLETFSGRVAIVGSWLCPEDRGLVAQEIRHRILVMVHRSQEGDSIDNTAFLFLFEYGQSLVPYLSLEDQSAWFDLILHMGHYIYGNYKSEHGRYEDRFIEVCRRMATTLSVMDPESREKLALSLFNSKRPAIAGVVTAMVMRHLAPLIPEPELGSLILKAIEVTADEQSWNYYYISEPTFGAGSYRYKREQPLLSKTLPLVFPYLSSESRLALLRTLLGFLDGWDKDHHYYIGEVINWLMPYMTAEDIMIAKNDFDRLLTVSHDHVRDFFGLMRAVSLSGLIEKVFIPAIVRLPQAEAFKWFKELSEAVKRHPNGSEQALNVLQLSFQERVAQEARKPENVVDFLVSYAEELAGSHEARSIFFEQSPAVQMVIVARLKTKFLDKAVELIQAQEGGDKEEIRAKLIEIINHPSAEKRAPQGILEEIGLEIIARSQETQANSGPAGLYGLYQQGNTLLTSYSEWVQTWEAWSRTVFPQPHSVSRPFLSFQARKEFVQTHRHGNTQAMASLIAAEADADWIVNALKSIRPHGVAQRLSVDQINVAAALMDQLPHHKRGRLKKTDNSQCALLLEIVRYGLPITPQTYELALKSNLEEFQQSLKKEAAVYDAYRRGALIPKNAPLSEYEKALRAMDLQKQVSAAHFQEEASHLGTLPPIFLKDSFTAYLPEVRTAHALVDKAVLGELIDPSFNILLLKLISLWSTFLDSKDDEAERMQPALRNALKDDKWKNSDQTKVRILARHVLRALAGHLVPRLKSKNQNDRRLTDMERDLLLGTAGVLAWDGLSDAKKTAINVLKNPKISSDLLTQGVRALNDFYHDAFQDVFKEAGFPDDLREQKGNRAGVSIAGDYFPEIRRLRKMAREMSEKISQVKTLNTFPVEFVPSKSQTDIYSGTIGQDCTKGRWNAAIQRKDMQVYRIITDNRIVGLLYVHKSKLASSDSLVLAIQPRGNWQVDYKSLLQAIQVNFARLAVKNGYSRVVMMNSQNLQSNIRDVLDLIAAQRYPVLNLDRMIETEIFVGHSFLTLWEKGQPIPEKIPSDEAPPVKKEKKEKMERPKEAKPAQPSRKKEPGIAIVLARQEVEEPDAIDDLDEVEEVVRPIQRIQHPDRPPVVAIRQPNPVDATALQQVFVRLLDRMPVAMKQQFATMARLYGAEMMEAYRQAGIRVDAQAMANPIPQPAEPLPFEDRIEQPLAPGEEAEFQRQGDGDEAVKETAIVRFGHLVPRNAFVLFNKGATGIFMNPRVTRTDRGWIEPTLEGKNRVIQNEEGHGQLPTRGDEVLPQDLYDFANIVLIQAQQFKAFLIFLRNRGADVQPLATVVQELNETLNEGMEDLFAREFEEALRSLQQADGLVTRFREVMRQVANTIGMDVDPVTGAVTPLQGNAIARAPHGGQEVVAARNQIPARAPAPQPREERPNGLARQTPPLAPTPKKVEAVPEPAPAPKKPEVIVPSIKAEIKREEPQKPETPKIVAVRRENPADAETLHRVATQLMDRLPLEMQMRFAGMMQLYGAEIMEAYRQAGLRTDAAAMANPIPQPKGPLPFDDRLQDPVGNDAAAGAQEKVAGKGYGKGANKPDQEEKSIVRFGHLVPRDALVLFRKGSMGIFLNPRVTRKDRGWIEPTLEGKKRIIMTEEGVGQLPMWGDEVLPQDLYDFGNIVLIQGHQFKAFLIFLKNRGANVAPLKAVVDEISEVLDRAMEDLFGRRFEESLRGMQEVDALVIRFREVMRQVANTVGLDVDPVNGVISPTQRRGMIEDPEQGRGRVHGQEGPRLFDGVRRLLGGGPRRGGRNGDFEAFHRGSVFMEGSSAVVEKLTSPEVKTPAEKIHRFLMQRHRLDLVQALRHLSPSQRRALMPSLMLALRTGSVHRMEGVLKGRNSSNAGITMTAMTPRSSAVFRSVLTR